MAVGTGFSTDLCFYLFTQVCVCVRAQNDLKGTQTLKAFTKYIYFAKNLELFSNRPFFKANREFHSTINQEMSEILCCASENNKNITNKQ